MLRRTFALMAVAAVAFWVAPAVADEPKEGTHEGKVVKAESGKLTISDKEGKNEQTLAITDDTKVTCDGKPCKVEDLKAGYPVKVKVEKKEDKLQVVSVDARKAD